MTIVNSPTTHATTTSLPATTPWPSMRPPPWSSKSVFSNPDNVISASAVSMTKSTRQSHSFRVRDDLFFQYFPESCEFLEYKQATTTITSSSASIESVVSSLLVLLRSLVVIPDGCAATNGLLLLASNKVTNVHRDDGDEHDKLKRTTISLGWPLPREEENSLAALENWVATFRSPRIH